MVINAFEKHRVRSANRLCLRYRNGGGAERFAIRVAGGPRISTGDYHAIVLEIIRTKRGH